MKHVRSEPKEKMVVKIAFGAIIFLLTFFGMALATGQSTQASDTTCRINPVALVPGMQGVAATQDAVLKATNNC